MNDPFQIGDRLLVIYDGRCGFCNSSVRWLLVRDRHDRLRFAPSESPKVATLLSHLAVQDSVPASTATDGPGSILVLLNPGGPAQRLLLRSDAVLTLLAELSAPWPAVSTVSRGIPCPLRDLAYRLVARWRYRIWGRLASCPLPTPEQRDRFL